jgi:ribosomal protein S18 acetylase RimI-like enzyme
MPSAPDVRSPAVTLRRATDADRELLLAVYRSTRAAELDLVPWDEATRTAFVTQQFEAQDRAWSQQRPDAVRDVVLVDGVPAGRLYVDRTADEIRVVDITLLPEHRGRGVGQALLEPVLAEGDRDGLPVTIHVERHNPALRLYARLGFEVVEDLGGVYLFLSRPARQPKTAS